MQGRSLAHTTEIRAQGPVPFPNTGSKLQPPSVSHSTFATSDVPLSMDSDAEAAYAHGSRQYPRRRHKVLPASLESSTGLGSNKARRTTYGRSSSQLPSEDEHEGQAAEHEYRPATPDPPPLSGAEPDTERSPETALDPEDNDDGFFHRLRTSSFAPTFPSLSVIRRNSKVFGNKKHPDAVTEPAWSGDSSSDDDDLSLFSKRNSRHPSAFDLNAAFPDDNGR